MVRVNIVMRKRVRQFLIAVASTFAGIVAALWLAVVILKPGPPGKIVLATGGAGGLYNELAATYVADLARRGVVLELRPDLEGANTMRALLATNATEAHAGIVKGGMLSSLQGKLASAEDRREHEREADSLRSAGRLFAEPIWVFYRGPKQVRSLSEFKGKRILVGSPQSGSRLVVSKLLKANGVDASNSTIVTDELSDDAVALINGSGADVAFVIAAAETPKVQKLLRVPNIFLMNFAPDADAYVNRFPSLSKLVLRQGAVEFAPEIPSAEITLLSVSAALVVRKDLHPALMTLLTHTVVRNPKRGFDKDGDPILFYEAGKFPSIQDPEYELVPDARALYRTGELPLLLRTLAPLAKSMHINFWVPAFVHQHGSQALLLLIPILSVLLPLTRILPATYNWSVRRRLLYWYRQLKHLENNLRLDGDEEHRDEKLADLERIDHAVRRIRVPLNFSDQLYDLRGHINLVRQRLQSMGAVISRAAE